MQTKWSNGVYALVVMMVMVEVHGFSGPSTHIANPNDIYSRLYFYQHALMDLKASLNVCTGKFLCGVETNGDQCGLQCISQENVCDGYRHCFNNADEEEWWCSYQNYSRNPRGGCGGECVGDGALPATVDETADDKVTSGQP